MNVFVGRAIRYAVHSASLAWFLGTNGTQLIAQQPSASIRNQLRDSGSFERIVVNAYPPLQLADLVVRADLIVEASTAGGRSYLNTTETEIVTDYTFTVHSVIKNRRWPGFRAGHVVTVRRDSGTVVLDSRTAVIHENGFPDFAANESYILFLTQRPQDKTYSVLGGSQGAFKAGDRVTTVAVPVDDTVALPAPVTRAEFLGEVRALLQFSVN